MKKIAPSILVSDCRVAVSSSNYDQGSRLHPFSIGALPVALAYNAISKSRANQRRQGNMMVGHVRYPWLVTVGFCEKRRLVPDALRLSLMVPQPGVNAVLLLTLTMPGVPVREMARDVVKRAAIYRLNRNGHNMSDEERLWTEHRPKDQISLPSLEASRRISSMTCPSRRHLSPREQRHRIARLEPP